MTQNPSIKASLDAGSPAFVGLPRMPDQVTLTLPPQSNPYEDF